MCVVGLGEAASGILHIYYAHPKPIITSSGFIAGESRLGLKESIGWA